MRNLTLREQAGLAAAVFALVTFAVGAWMYRQQGEESATSPLNITQTSDTTEVLARGPEALHKADEPATQAALPKPTPGGTVSGDPLTVYVTGAVVQPGVYTLKSGDRIYKAVHAAGGFKKNAVQEALNLADRLQDGDQVHIPVRAAQTAAATPPPVRSLASAFPAPASVPPRRARVLGNPSPPASSARRGTSAARQGDAGTTGEEKAPAAGKLKTPSDGTVNINTANAEEMERLPGVGPAMAQRILAHRKEVGTFSSPEQLLEVRGIGDKKFATMQPFVRVK